VPIIQKLPFLRPPLFGLLALAWCLWVTGAVAQGDPAQATGGQRPQGELQVELERFGVGNQARAGDWAGLRVRVMDLGTRQREVIVRLEGLDSDGDRPQYQTSMTANPGVWQQTWLYARQPFDTATRGAFTLYVYEGVEASPGEPGTPGYTTGRLLFRGTLTDDLRAPQAISPTLGLIGLVGTRPLGLQTYSRQNTTTPGIHELGNHASVLVTGLTPDEFPDRWMGLAPYEAIVWVDGEPARLRGDRARALREWVMRGGHLIIVLPLVGQTWLSPTSNELYDIMPAVSVERREGELFEPYRPLLTSSDAGTFPRQSTVQVFVPRGQANETEAMPILAGPDGACVVVRRLVGTGAIDMVGLDLNQTALSQFNMIDAEVFWHRVLGRRGQLTEFQAQGGRAPAPGMRAHLPIDSDIPRTIAKAGRSAAGVLVGFVVFAAYWAVAGPVGFAVLRRRNLSHYSWPFFVLCAGVFTALAWGGAAILRPKRVEVTHLTVLDHVFGQNTQRARMWASVLIPSYGDSTISVADDVEGAPASRRPMGVVASWDPASNMPVSVAAFPDSRGYPVDSRAPDRLTAPARSTVKQVQVDWAGGPRWEMPIPVADDGKPVVAPLRLVHRGDRGAALPLVTGAISHGLPGPLTNVVVMVVTQQRPLPMSAPRPQTLDIAQSPLLTEAYAFAVTGEWLPDVPLSLDVVTRAGAEARALNDASAQAFFSRLMPVAGAMGAVAPTIRPDDMGPLLAFFHQLPMPDPASTALTTHVPVRNATQGLDLGRWFTQPCVIVLGVLGADTPREGPVRMSVDGEPAPVLGRTLVRWVYPLPASPPRFPVRSVPGVPAGGQPAGGEPVGDEPVGG
jgi:hypothetical protein